jgi:hypothetical protein
MPDVALWDLVAPYFLLGNAAGNVHAALAVLAVDEYEEADDPSSSVLRGRARLHGGAEVWFDPANFSFGVNAGNTEGHPRDDPARRSPWIDLRDTTIDFQLLAPHVGSAIVAAGHAPIDSPPPPAFVPTDAVLDALDSAPVDIPFSDFPSTEFVLDLVITSAVLRPPFLAPARMRADGALEPHPDLKEVQLTLPKIKLRIRQGSTVGSQPQIDILSFGASGLDDPGDIGVAELVTMQPPYAFIGPGRTVGFGFRSAVLDLSDGSTPPAVLEQFGFDQSWTGVYFPEIRLFVAPQGAQGWAVNAGAENLLIGIGASSGITGDFELDVINQGGSLRIGARFSAPGGRTIAIHRTSETAASVVLPEHSTIVVDLEGGRPPYITQISLDGGTTFTTERVMQVDMSAASRTIVVKGTASGAPSPTLTITAQRGDSSGASGSSTTTLGAIPSATVTATATTRNGVAVANPRLVIDSQTDTTVTVRLDDNSAATWTVAGVALPGGPARTATFELAAGTHKEVRAAVAGATTTAPIYFHYDEPDQMTDAQLAAYAVNADLTRTADSIDDTIEHGWTGGVPVLLSSEHADAMRAIAPGTSVVIVGHASWEGDDSKAAYNRLLSDRRAKVAAHLYAALAGPGNTREFHPVAPPRGFADAKPAQQADPVANPRRHWWRVELQSPVTIAGALTIGTVDRQPVPSSTVVTPPAPVDPPPPTPEAPDFLRSIGAKVRIIRDEFIAVELHGEVDFDTVAESRLRGQGISQADMPSFQGLGHQNPGDGIVKFRGVFTRNPGSDEWALDLLFGADPSDVDGLVMTGSLPGQPLLARQTGRNLLGLYALFFPLLAAGSTETPGSAEVEDLIIEGALLALPAVLAATGWFTVERVVWYGGEVLVRQHAGEWSTSVLADIETAVSADIKIGPLRLITIARDKPLVARYKAIGVRFGATADGKAIFHPVFDSSKGYTIDVSRPGSLQVAEPLGRVLRVDGAKISRTNPTMLEVQLGSAVDLGVVSLERCGVRITLADPPGIELTALGVRVNVPGVVAGSGYLAISENGFAGRLDLTLVPLRLRIAGALRIENIPEAAGGPATGVAVAIEVEFPVAIPLWSSGLGIYGLIGLFAMHFSRNEEPDSASTTKALAWLTRAGGDPTHVEDPTLWKAEVDHWAFGVGALVGTMGSPVVFNMKGVFMLELPGPRLLLMMKANLLVPMPDQKGTAEGTLLAVIDLDAARETLTIGIVIDYTIDPILQIRIPVEAFFNGKKPEDWHLYLGKYPDQIRAKIFEVFSGSGYLMLAGDGQNTPDFKPDLPKPAGFAISAGLHVSMVWGSKSIGLYAELAAGFDAVLGFSPLLVAGDIYARGELRLFIISISASAKLTVRLGQPPGQPAQSGYKISGEVCGSIDLFFFEIEGCVDFTLEDNSPPGIVIAALVDGVTLVSRSPALVHGTASDDPVDAGIGDAKQGSAQPAEADMPHVPIDAIPVVMFSAPPMESGVKFLGTDIGGSSGGHEVQRSTDKITYTLTKVELNGPVSAGPTPATWWTLRPPTEPNESAQLALLSWIPNPTPKALQASDELTETVENRWGTVCDQAAPPTPVLWTFRFEPLGPSTPGWSLHGEAWPDPPATVRSAATPTVLGVHERWRCGDPMVDPFRGILPAEVVGALVACPRGTRVVGPIGPLTPRLRSAGELAMGTKLADIIDEPQITFVEMQRRLQAGLPVSRAALSRVVIDPELLRPDAGAQHGGVAAAATAGKRCASRILAAPRFDRLRPPESDPLRGDDIARRWSLLGFDPGDLADAVVLTPGPFDVARVLLFVPRRLLNIGLILRALTPEGEIVTEEVANTSQIVGVGTLPTTWVDPAGPWDDDIALVMNHLLALGKERYVAVLVELKGDLRADHIVVGLNPDVGRELADVLPGPAFYVAAIEALLASEISRFDTDTETVKRNHDVLEAALGPDSASVALLTPNTAYEVKLTWSASATSEGSDPASLTDEVQSFWFHTDADAPLRLDPYVLACIPYEDERHVFGGEPLQISFATNDVTALFAAHGYRLEVRLLASSARHPDPAQLAIPYPVVLDPTTVVPVTGAIFSPWEDAVAAVVDPDCIAIDENRVRHTVTTIPIPLHPATDYLLDIRRVPVTAGKGTEARVFRRTFGTSQFASLAAYAEFCLGSRVTHRSVPAGLAGHVGAAFAGRHPEGEELDNVLRGAVAPSHPGIEPMPVPDRPQIVVWWEGGPTPQPTAIVIDANEPLWRSREHATLETLPSTNVQHWELTRDEWVAPIEAASSDGVVQRIVRAPGGQRAIAILAPGARGKHVVLELRRTAFKESYLDGPTATDEHEQLADISLRKAPWEED